MIEAGVAALYDEMGYQLEGSVNDGVRAVLQEGLRWIATDEMADISRM